jgi:hypothetical protein
MTPGKPSGRKDFMQAPHGDGCLCLGLTMKALDLKKQHLEEIFAWTGVDRIPTIRQFDNLQQDDSPSPLSAACQHDVRRAIRGLVRGYCVTRTVIKEPEVYWRTHTKLGLDSPADRWPDELDAVEWNSLYSGDQRLLAPIVDPRAEINAIGTGALSNILASGHDAEDDEQRDPAIDVPGQWSIQNTMRVLLVVRRSGTGWLHPRSEVTRALAKSVGRDPIEVLAFAQYLAKCDAGMGAASDVVLEVLRDFPSGSLDELAGRIEMIDSFWDSEEEEDPEGLLDLPERPIELPVFPVAAAADGGPNPLARLNQLLPGGRGTRGLPPIVYTETRLESRQPHGREGSGRTANETKAPRCRDRIGEGTRSPSRTPRASIQEAGIRRSPLCWLASRHCRLYMGGGCEYGVQTCPMAPVEASSLATQVEASALGLVARPMRVSDLSGDPVQSANCRPRS